MSSGNIQVATQIVGGITPDLERVHGIGGPSSPRLVVPLKIQMQPRIASEALAVTNLICTLYVGDTRLINQVGQPVIVDLMRGLPARTVPNAAITHYTEVSFPLSPSLVCRLEESRHRDPNKTFSGLITISTSVAWLAASGGGMASEQNMESIPGYNFHANFGICYLLARFPETMVDDIALHIPASTWIEQVLPGLGLNHLRLVEISLPQSGGALTEDVVPLFDAARAEYDAGRYRECIQKCRDVRYTIENHLGATKGSPVEKVIQERVASPLTDGEQRFLGQCWKAVVDFTSESHHQSTYVAADAHACLLLTAILLEFVQKLLAPPPIGHGLSPHY